MGNTSSLDPRVAAVFESFPAPIRRKLLALRQLVFDTADDHESVGRLTETLKWGEPAYLTEESGTGTTIRIGWKPSDPSTYRLYVNCQTDLIDRFRGLFATDLEFEGKRAIVFQEDDEAPIEALTVCIGMALNYHRDKKLAGRL